MNNVTRATGLLLTSFLFALAGCSDFGSDSKNNAEPTLQLFPQPAFDFGTITQGNSASPLEITISNSGSARLDVSSMSLSDLTHYQIDTMSGTNPCQTASPALNEGENCTVLVSFNPLQTGTFPTSLEITSNDAASPTQLNITGTLEPATSMSVTINQVDLSACPNVTAFVSVTDQGNFPIEGLGLADFTIEEDSTTVGNPTQAPFVESIDKPISIAFAMDYSGSMSDIDIAESNRAAHQIVDQIGITDEVEIIKFDENIEVIQRFTSDKQLLRDAINSDFTNGGTALFDAIQLAVNDVDAQITERKVVIVTTDGVEKNSVSFGLQDIIDNAIAKDIPVFVIALGENVDINTLQQITTATSAELYEAEFAQNIRTIIEQQVSEILFFDQYVLTYNSTSSGGSDVALKVTATNGMLTGIGTRTLPLCP